MKPMKMTDMAKTEEQVQRESSPMVAPQNINRYPYGLSICLDQDDLKKLDLEPDCEAGDMLHLHALAKVTSVSESDSEAGKRCRIELQITHLEVEDEDEENEEADDGRDQTSKRASKRYKDEEPEDDEEEE